MRLNRPVDRAYLLKEALAKALDAVQLDRVRKALGQWLAWATHSCLAPFIKLAQTLKRHQDGILACIPRPQTQTNGLTRQLKSRTYLITRRTYGFHSTEVFEALVHLCCGGIVLDPLLPSPTSTP